MHIYLKYAYIYIYIYIYKDYVYFSILLGITMDTRKLKDIIPAARTSLPYTT